MAPTPEKRIPRKKCLSIGINYGDAKSKKTLRGPHRDAKKLTDLLISESLGSSPVKLPLTLCFVRTDQFSYYPENVTLMLDVPETDPTHKEHLHPTYDNIVSLTTRFFDSTWRCLPEAASPNRSIGP